MSEVDIDKLKKSITQESPTRYIFNSLTQQDIAHVVDLTSNKLNGECTCQHFQMRVKPMIKQGILDPSSEKARCKHIRVARQVFYEAILKIYVEQNNIDTEELY